MLVLLLRTFHTKEMTLTSDGSRTSSHRPSSLRVGQSLPLPPLSLALSGGFAARREDGLGGWPLLVHSSISRVWFRSCFASVASGAMPLSRSPLARPSRAWWSPDASPTYCPRKTVVTGSGSGASLPSRISSWLSRSPNLREDPLFLLFTGGHHGGGDSRRARQSFRSCRSRCSSSTPASEEGLRRHLWLPAAISSLVFSMAEARPLRATAPGPHRHFLIFFLPSLMLIGRQCSYGFESIVPSSGARWSGGHPAVPSGLVPGDDERVSEQQLLGPDCNLRSICEASNI